MSLRYSATHQSAPTKRKIRRFRRTPSPDTPRDSAAEQDRKSRRADKCQHFVIRKIHQRRELQIRQPPRPGERAVIIRNAVNGRARIQDRANNFRLIRRRPINPPVLPAPLQRPQHRLTIHPEVFNRPLRNLAPCCRQPIRRHLASCILDVSGRINIPRSSCTRSTARSNIRASSGGVSFGKFCFARSSFTCSIYANRCNEHENSAGLRHDRRRVRETVAMSTRNFPASSREVSRRP